jgi:hypothetical protein
MTIGFRARVAGSLAITVGLVWAFTLGKNWLFLAPLGTGAVLYLAGLLGVSDKISQTRGYSLLLLILSAVAALISIGCQVSVGFVATDLVGQLLFLGVLIWFYRETLAVFQSKQ